MSYKKNRIIIGDINNRKLYLEDNPYCSICGSSQVNIHHHYRLGKRYLDQNFEIELPENYSSLCLQCHSIIHTDENQYNRRIWGTRITVGCAGKTLITGIQAKTEEGLPR
jgi:hypothetical protein